MAREINDIVEEMTTKASEFEALNELENNSSKVAFWRNIKQVIAFIVRSLEILFDKQKEEINTLIDNTEAGSLSWYVTQGLNYQHGDRLVLINNRPKYVTRNNEKQIIKRCAVRELETGLEVLVVKEENGSFLPLSEDEKKGFSDYMNKVKFAGIPLNIQSLPADKLNATITVQVNPLVFLSDGTEINSGKKHIEENVTEYLKNFDFDGTFYISKFIDAIQHIEGVEDVFVENAELHPDGQAGVLFTRKINTVSGYLEAHENMGFTYVFD